MVKKYHRTDDLANHPFVKYVFHDAVRITAAIQAPGSAFKVDAEYKRDPTQAEFYCISTGSSLAQLIGICQQMEHSILYFSSFTPTEKMKKNGITRQSHLLYCIENYIIRTQSMYDRVLRLVDKAFCLYNPSHLISHELIISNIHIRHSSIPSKLKSIRKSIKGYYRDRNEIMHEREYLENDLRRLEAYTILATDEPYRNDKYFKLEIKDLIRQIVKGKTKTFTSVNKNAFNAISELFDELMKKYQEQLRILEAIHGTIELNSGKKEKR